jgi:hypothetical protein
MLWRQIECPQQMLFRFGFLSVIGNASQTQRQLSLRRKALPQAGILKPF